MSLLVAELPCHAACAYDLLHFAFPMKLDSGTKSEPESDTCGAYGIAHSEVCYCYS